MVDIITRDEIERAHKCYFFTPDSMRFFDSRISSYGYGGPGGVYFVTSERFHGSQGHSAARRYTVRRQDDAGEIHTVGEFQAYASRSGANAAARKLAARIAP